jgi:hypothetical protein
MIFSANTYRRRLYSANFQHLLVYLQPGKQTTFPARLQTVPISSASGLLIHHVSRFIPDSSAFYQTTSTDTCVHLLHPEGFQSPHRSRDHLRPLRLPPDSAMPVCRAHPDLPTRSKRYYPQNRNWHAQFSAYFQRLARFFRLSLIHHIFISNANLRHAPSHVC